MILWDLLQKCVFILVAESRRVIIVGDSVIKNMDPLDGVVVKCFPSAIIAKLSRLLPTDVKLLNFEYIIIHVGANNIGNRDSCGYILSNYGNLIASVKKLKPSIRMIVSAILPRPVDHDDTDSMITAVNFVLN